MPARTPHRATVLSKERLTPHMLRVVFALEAAGAFEAGAFSDHYVKLQVPEGGGEIRTRTYTVRDWDVERRRLTIDFVVHGDIGVAGPWAEAAEIGDALELFGPGGGYTPDPDADWHLLAGDASVIPAIAASLPRIPAGVPVHVVIEVDGPAEEQSLSSPGDLQLRWLHRSRAPGEEPDLLVDVIRALELPAGSGHAFVHGEASSVRAVRRHLLVDRGLDRSTLSATGYWKLRRTEEGWRDDKAEWVRLAEADAPAVG